MGRAQLHKGDDGNKDEEQHSLGLAHAAGLGVEVEGVVNVERKHFGGVNSGAVRIDYVRITAGEGKVLVEKFKAVGKGKEGADNVPGP